ncbi:MAG: OmpA family protein [Reinekea forsetii]|jgi:outer membrane protein OmpA-like peptidoglycan-associated protein|uniref:Outer membrane protein A, OmpA n=1 Tax=Reinekea forsetii TaxID=1336806 RepID=A0A2K8KM44_9GAMM|nr:MULTISPECIES: OmpA family protein [Reinekea]ATX75209.1 outer membrane protein A precursor, OmpA [Reinekea forsetii]MDO7640955.1 OmpA family protein [Reinekea forsetii]MDO7644784.1 OmpA family protein [Reinekea forsetii]MDO7674068.1 OmpA family protein [Reinekea forsetii]
MNHWLKLSLPLALSGALISGCTTMDAFTGENQISGTSKGALAGGLLGAVIGAATAPKADRAKRALIGAGIGGVAGGGVGFYMDNQEKQLREELVGTGVQVRRTEAGQIDLIMPGNITFDVSSAAVQASFKPTLASVARVLSEYDDTLVTISGHTDSSGSNEYNQLLSEQRASAVANIILESGIVFERVAAVGYGENQPIADNGTANGRAENRRVEITLDAIVAD